MFFPFYILHFRLQEPLCKKNEWIFFLKVRKKPRCEFQISSQGLIKKGIVRKLMKAINSASGRAAGGDFPSKIGTSLDVPLSMASSGAPGFYRKRKVNCNLFLGRNMRVRLSSERTDNY